MISVDEINKLKAENEAYKQSEQEAKEIIAELKASNNALRVDAARAKQKAKEYLAENERLTTYKQALAEIKEIAGKILCTELCNNCDGCGLINGCADTNCAYYQMDKIFTKISEVENGN